MCHRCEGTRDWALVIREGGGGTLREGVVTLGLGVSPAPPSRFSSRLSLCELLGSDRKAKKCKSTLNTGSYTRCCILSTQPGIETLGKGSVYSDIQIVEREPVSHGTSPRRPRDSQKEGTKQLCTEAGLTVNLVKTWWVDTPERNGPAKNTWASHPFPD